MPTFAVSNPNGLYLKVHPNLGITWSQLDFNKYPSKYAAKKHLKELDNIPHCAKVVLIVTNEDLTNGN